MIEADAAQPRKSLKLALRRTHRERSLCDGRCCVTSIRLTGRVIAWDHEDFDEVRIAPDRNPPILDAVEPKTGGDKLWQRQIRHRLRATRSSRVITSRAPLSSTR